MSKINAFRVINLNYNNNSNRVEDETFLFDGESTLLSLQNGGGKTVLVQMMLAPFVHKRFRNTTNRPFESFFTTNKPTFLLVEWVLDGGAGYVLIGMMVRKHQMSAEEENQEELEIINFVHEYQESNDYDIHKFPIIEQEGKRKKLKNFTSCRKLFDELRSEKAAKFKAFDMNQSNQQKQYFQRLKEYGINSEEWETIIKRINLKESGLSELFKEAKDEFGLVEKWFLPAIETKLNKEENRIKQFRTLLIKFIQQYKENEVKIERKATIIEFKQDTVELEENAVKCLGLNNQVLRKQEQIGFLRHCIDDLLKQTQAQEATSQEILTKLQLEVEQIGFEQVSYLIYQLMEELDSLFVEQNFVSKQKEELQQEHSSVSKVWQINQCAKLYEDYKEEEVSLLKLENQYEIMKKKEEELMPERANLGYSLHLAYLEKVEKLQSEIYNINHEVESLKLEQNSLQAKETEEKIAHFSYQEEYGSRKSKIQQYQEIEGQFNKKFSYKLERNILGNYEEGTFEVLQRNQEQELKQAQHETVTAHSNRQKREEEREGIQRNIQDCNKVLGQLKELMKFQQEKEEKYNKEMEVRLRYMKYLSIPEENQLNKEFICLKFREKVVALQESMKQVEREKEKLEKELDKMKHGVILDMPKKFEALLNSLDIHYVTGMEYLKHSGYNKEQNKELLKKVPLLPFSIMMSERELNKLAKTTVNFYTSFPIPIIIKEQISQFPNRDDSLIFKEQQVNLFVAFNKQLLDEKELELLVKEKEEHVIEVEKQLQTKKDEISYYDSMGQEIAYQELNQEKYQAVQKEKEISQQQNEEEEKRLLQLRSDKANNDESIENLQKQCKDLEEKNQKLTQMKAAIENIRIRYEKYLEDHKKMDQLKHDMDRLAKESRDRQKRVDDIYQLISDKKLNSSILDQELKTASDKNNKYASYKEGTKIQKELVDIETRYEAITEKMNHDVKLIEEQLDKARNRFTKIQDRLIELSNKYEVEDNQYKKVPYSQYRERELEQQVADLSEKLEAAKKKWNRLDKEIAIKESKIADKKADMNDKFQREEPIPKEQIVDISFKARAKLVQLSIQEEEKKQKGLISRRIGYEANISALSEFSDFTYENEFDFVSELEKYQKSSLEELHRKEVEELYGNMIRDYRNLQEYARKQKLALEKNIEYLLSREKYKEDFYYQPLSLMKQLVDKPEDLIKQLSIILQSYGTLLEKLEIDIAFIDREKEKIVEMFFDYVNEINKNLDKIDRNSTITLKDRSIKMLKIQVASWEENKEIYLQRMTALFNELVNAGLQCMTDNLNLDEMIGVRVTSKTLYDLVVGIGTTNIKLYKIEAQREYPITWAQVSKNSGGEGFLSAFVVLTSLLSYMRRDESDLFIEREEGKVLVMDNPFAQTNASHLLIPLMDIAKKCNTQLICLTGLGGESIYNRFDNIYVLNLVESGLQREVQYLKADHVKGDTKVYQLSTSRVQIEEAEQMELLF
ncbi:MAG: hypothetical protein ACERKN_15260 [Velocimicrobium sp.]